MKITKYVHSCLHIEDVHLSILIDPGRFTWDSHLLKADQIEHLSHVIITHDHPDHYWEPALTALAKHSPHAKIITNNDLHEKISKLKLPNEISGATEDDIAVFEAPHVALPMGLKVPLNIGVHISGRLTHPGDAFDISRTCDYLALPITAPFASFKDALNAAVKIKPKVVIPVHDWEWHSAARKARYGFAKELLGTKNIKFLELENAKPLEI